MILTRKECQTDIGFAVRLASLCTQDHKSLCAAATICATLVNIPTQTDSVLASLLSVIELL